MKSKDCKTVMTELHWTHRILKDYKTLRHIPTTKYRCYMCVETQKQ